MSKNTKTKKLDKLCFESGCMFIYDHDTKQGCLSWDDCVVNLAPGDYKDVVEKAIEYLENE